MLSLVIALALAAEPRSDADTLETMLAQTIAELCATDGGKPAHCALARAFQAAKPASAKPGLLSLGTMDEVGTDEVRLQLLDLSAEGATVAVIEPDDDSEQDRFAIIEKLRRGDRKDPLLRSVAKQAKSMPHFPTSLTAGSLFFQVPEKLGGHWLRKVPGKILMLSFNGDTHRPALRFSEFPDDRK